ncbi:WD repeat-containing WRAP73-like protein [Cladobotryum mycophilum]|uniref:WD repeat-containing WRAP73-like protein n=1 Tax=Cladobotryum mycophilum TaxID=491253 RepID=A0ABR0SDP6_9HYPO
MHSSAVFKSSPHCRPSPDGRLIATLDSWTVSIRSTDTLQITNVVKLGPGSGSSSASSSLSSSASTTFLWAPSSAKFLVSVADQIEVFSAVRASPFRATISSPLSGGGKPSAIQFGARDTELLVWSTSGLKLVIFDLCTSKVVEITSPKFHQPASVSRGLSFRPGTGHLVLLTRVGGKDLVSLHHPISRQVQRSWSPDTLDAQGLTWTPDGRWLLVWESPAQGHRILLYAADGQHFRTIGAANLLKEPSADLEPGIKLCQLSPDAQLCAVGDHGRGIAVIRTDSWRTSLRLLHPTTIVPRDTLQVWQEQIAASSLEGRSTHTFLRATQLLSPPGPPADSKTSAELKPGCSMAAFDASSTLLATRLDDSPCAVWIWDVAAAELRAVLIFHGSVNFQWHPSSRELLLVTCLDTAQRGMAFVWDPLSNGPTPVAPEDHLPNGKAVGKIQIVWINRETEFPVLLVSDAQHYVMLSPLSLDQGLNPWQRANEGQWDDGEVQMLEGMTPARVAADDTDETSVLDDTFSFRNA